MTSGPYRFFAGLLALVATGLGLAILAITLVRGGGSTGFLIGSLFTALGCARFYLLLRR